MLRYWQVSERLKNVHEEMEADLLIAKQYSRMPAVQLRGEGVFLVSPVTDAGPTCWVECQGEGELIFHATDSSLGDESILVLVTNPADLHAQRETRSERTTWIDTTLTDVETRKILGFVVDEVKRIEMRPFWASITFTDKKARDKYRATFETRINEILRARRHLNPETMNRARSETVEAVTASIH